MTQKLKQAQRDIALDLACKNDNPEQVDGYFTDYDIDEENDQAFGQEQEQEQEPEQDLEQEHGD